MKQWLKALLDIQSGKKKSEGEQKKGKEELAEDLPTRMQNLLYRLTKDPLAEKRGMMGVDKYGGTTSFK